MSRLILPGGAILGRRLLTRPAPPPSGGGGGAQLLSFVEDATTDFLNPERGWMFNYSSTGQIANTRTDGGAVVHPSLFDSSNGVNNPWRLDQQRNGAAIPQGKLDQVAAWFGAARSAGVKIKVRFAYHGNPTTYAGDASITTVLAHVAQLTPVLQANLDVIASMDLGLVGRWGEWNQSTNGFDQDTAQGRSLRAQLIDAILDLLGPTRMAHIRYPIWAYEWFGNTFQLPPGDTPFSGTRQARLGWYNDCIVSSPSDGGTFRGSWAGPTAFQQDLDTFAAMGRRAATSGETCSAFGAPNASSAGAAAITQFTNQGGPDHLNRSYYEAIYSDWIATGHYNEISRRLGYRLVLESAEVPESVTPGASMQVKLTIRNRGFGKVYNPRPIDLVMVGASNTRTVRLTADARRDLPLAGEVTTTTYTVTAPVDLSVGQLYSLFLRLPDPDPLGNGLAADNRYAIRLANLGVWSGATGRNDLGAFVTVNPA